MDKKPSDLTTLLGRLEALGGERAIETPELVDETGRRRAVLCSVCHDRGWRTVADAGAGAAIRCECQTAPYDGDQLRARLAVVGMCAEELDAAWSPWDVRHQPKPDWARAWLGWVLTGAEGPPPAGIEGGARPWCLSLVGPPGCGKTKTLAVLMRHYVAQGGVGAMWVRVPEFFSRVQRERGAEGWSATEQRAENAGFLALDEAGREHRRRRATETESAADMLIGEILMYRHRRQSLTGLTANLRLADFGDGAVESRIREGCLREMGSPHGDYRNWRKP